MDYTQKEFFNDLQQEFQKLKQSQAKENKTRTKTVQDPTKDTVKDANPPDNEFSFIASKLDDILSKLTKKSPEYIKVLSMVASLLYEKAKIALNVNLTKSQEYLESALDLIEEVADDPSITFVYLRIINYLAYVVSRMGDLERAKTLLESIVNKELLCEPHVYSTEDLFSNKKCDPNTNRVKVEKLMINNLQMLGWIYGKLGSGEKYAEVVHRSLQKELDLNDGDPLQWAMRCYRLASLFLAQDRWDNARYHLTAAQGVLDPLEVGLLPNPVLFKTQADLARVWVNYGLQLFGVSKKSILEKVWEETEEIQKPEIPSIDLNKFLFSGMELKLPSVPTKQIENIQEARELFSHTHKWLKRARLYYTLRDYPLQYVNIVLELSELYRYLAFYEKDLDSQYEVHKKRYETLETLSAILKEVRPSCYTAVSVEIVREIMEVQIELMSLNLKKLYSPCDAIDLTKTDLQKRIATVAHINAKIESLCNDNGAEAMGSTVQESQEDDNGDKGKTDPPNDLAVSSGEGEGTDQEKLK